MNGGLAHDNYGTIRNIQINLTESTELKNNELSLGVWVNSGIIENFIINLKVPLYISTGSMLLSRENTGTIKKWLCVW